MEVTKRSRRSLRWHNVLFVVLFLLVIGLLGWLSTRYVYQADWTASGRNTLSEASITLLGQLEGPVHVTAYARETPLLRQRIRELVDRYRRYKPDIALEFVNPDREPQKVRELNITVDGELVLEYAGRTEQIQDLTENGLTNALQRLARGGERRLVFVTGHGERRPDGAAGYDLSAWVRQLETRGIRSESLNLVETPDIPARTTVLVIAAPRVAWLPGEVAAVRDYIRRGGNLLWLADPEQGGQGLEPLAQELGLRFEPGIVVDPNVSQVGLMLFGTDDPRVALVASYPPHALTRGFELNTLFPIAAGIAFEGDDDWQRTAFLKTLSNTWSETGAVSGRVTFDEGKDIAGPLNIGVALSREIQAREAPAADAQKSASGEDDRPGRRQRIVVVGDADFISNAFIGLAGNLQLGLNIANWLTSDEDLIVIPARTAPDASLQFSRGEVLAIFGFLFSVPLLLLGSGVFIWWRRRRL